MTRPIIVFDLDGTLVDTAPDLLDSLNHSLDDVGVGRPEPETFRQYLGQGARVMIERAFAAQQKVLPAVEHDRLFDLFLDHYRVNMPGRSQPYPGVLDALERFAAAGFIMAVCTNKQEAFARRLLGGLGIAETFAAICGQDTFDCRKPDPRHLTQTIALAGGERDNAVMVGDSETDILTAQRAGIPVVAVDFGYTDRHVREFGPSVVISHFDELTVGLCDRLLVMARG